VDSVSEADVDLVGLVDEVGAPLAVAREQTEELEGLIADTWSALGHVGVGDLGKLDAKCVGSFFEVVVVDPQSLDAPNQSWGLGHNLVEKAIGGLDVSYVLLNSVGRMIDGHRHP